MGVQEAVVTVATTGMWQGDGDCGTSTKSVLV
jgi:hypothetical protein